MGIYKECAITNFYNKQYVTKKSWKAPKKSEADNMALSTRGIQLAPPPPSPSV